MNSGSGTGLTLLLVLAGLYLLPTLIAMVRVRTNIAAIFALNLFLGWSVIGWVVSLVWALSSDKPTVVAAPVPAGEALGRWNSKRCPQCAEKIQKAAKVCRYCGHALEARAKA